MKKDAIADVWSKAQASLIRNRNPILFGLGCAGIIASDAALVAGTVKAVRAVDARKKRERKESLTKKEIVQTVWKEYITSFGMQAASFISMGFAFNNEHGKATASALACTMAEGALREYKNKVVETIGERKEREVQDAVSKAAVREAAKPDAQVYITNKGSVLCLDPITKRLFESDIEAIRKAENNLNRTMRNEMRVSLNEFYMELGLDTVDIGDDLGWNIDRGYIDIYLSTQMTADNRPCVVINHNNPPVYNY